MYTKNQSRKLKKLMSYEQYVEGYKQWRKDKEQLHLNELYNNTLEDTEKEIE